MFDRMNGRYKNIFIILLLFHLIALSVYGVFRMIGGDEGVYFSATRAVGLGKALYSGFFFTQMPLLPTAFSALAVDGWTSFWILRGFAIAAGFLSAIFLFLIVLKTTRNMVVSLIALGMYIFSGLILSMHTIFESPVFAHLFSLAVFYFWLKYSEGKKLIYLVLMSLILSLLINLRATFIVLLPFYIWSVLSLADKGKLKVLIISAISLLPPAIPTFLRIAASPGHFFFDNFMFQIYREPDKSIGYFAFNKFNTLFRTVIDPHLLIIIVLTIISIAMLVRGKKIAGFKDAVRKQEGMALVNLILIAAIYMMPHPILRHYFEQFMGFAIIVIAFNLENMLIGLSGFITSFRKKMILGLLFALYILSVIPYIAIDIMAVREGDPRRLLSEVHSITSKMLELAGPQDTVLSEWAIYPFLSRQPVLPYTDILGFHFPLPLSHDEFMKYRLCDSIYIKDAVTRRIPSLVVTVFAPAPYLANSLNNRYEMAYQSSEISIYKRK